MSETTDFGKLPKKWNTSSRDNLPKPGELEESAAREEFEHCILSESVGSSNTAVFHLPNGEEGPLCATAAQKQGWKVRDWGCYPQGWFDLCARCMVKWANMS